MSGITHQFSLPPLVVARFVFTLLHVNGGPGLIDRPDDGNKSVRFLRTG